MLEGKIDGVSLRFTEDILKWKNVRDMIWNIKKQEGDEKADYQLMYDSLFSDVTSALRILQRSEDVNAKKASQILMKGQCKTEEIYIESI